MGINTSPSNTDWQAALNLLGNDGVLCALGIPSEETITLLLNTLVFSQKKLVGSVVGGRHFMQEMLELAAAQQIQPLIEVMPISQINEAMDKVATNKARYRIVLTS